MALKNLIQNQTIIIDDHKRGAREIKNWDDSSNDIHIDKITNYPLSGERQRLRLKIPINSKRSIKIENAKGKNIEIPKKLEKEIKAAFSDENIRNNFIKDLIDILRNYSSILSNEEKAHNALANLAENFGLNWTKEKIANYIESALKNYTEVYNDKEGNEFFFKIGEKQIEIGQNNGYAKQFRKINR
ncbi:MAG: hypothetical protein WCJ72_18750 [Chryseobacterium sp.]